MSVALITESMDKQLAVLNELLQLGEEKKQALIANDADEVTRIAGKENKCIKNSASLEQERINAVQSFFLSLGLSIPASITISELVQYASKVEEKKALLATQERLVATAQKLQKLNELNQQLLRQSLEFINFSMDLYMGSEEEAVYKNPLQQHTGVARTGFYNFKA